MDTDRTAVECKALGRELLVASIDTHRAARESDIGYLATTAILSIHSNLGGTRRGHEFHVFKTGCLRDLVVETRDVLRPGLRDVYDDVPDLPVEVGRIDVILLVTSVNALASTSIFIRR